MGPGSSVRVQVRPLAMLALACVFWGLSFPEVHLAEGAVATQSAIWLGRDLSKAEQAACGCAFNVWRFGIAAVLYCLLQARQLTSMRATTVRPALAVGLAAASGMMLQTIGLRYTLPTVAAVLTGLVVVFTPLAQARRYPPTRWVWTAVGLALAGTFVLAQPNPGALAARSEVLTPPLPLLGELLVVLAAAAFTMQILGVDAWGHSVPSALLTLAPFAVGFLVNTVALFLLAPESAWVLVRPVLGSSVWLGAVSTTVLLSSIVAFHLMNTFQPSVPATTAGIVYCLEPAFAGLWSAALDTERFTPLTFCGATLIFGALVLIARSHPRERSPGAEAGP